MVSPLLPLLLSAAYFGDIGRPSSRLLDQDFGLGLQPEQLLLSRYYVPASRDRLLDVYYRPWAELLRQELGAGGGVSRITADKDTFSVILDVQQFKPEEIELKVGDKYIVVTAKHEEKKDEHGLISRQFRRKYAIPENVEPERITSQISSDGILTIRAPLKEVPEDKNERRIEIEYTGKPALRKEGEERVEDSTTEGGTTESASTAEK